MKDFGRLGGLMWPILAHPELQQAGRFPHDDRAFTRSYLGQPTVHCYEYPGRMRVDGRGFAFAAGDVTVTGAGQMASYDLPAPGYHLCIHFALPRAAGAGDVECCRLPMHVTAEQARVDGGSFAEAMLRLIRLEAMGEVDPLARAAASTGLQRLLLALGQAGAEERRASATRAGTDPVEDAAFLLRRGMDEALDVPRLARGVGLSQNYLARRFKQRFGVTMQRYHLRCRMEYAALLMDTTDVPVGQIALRIGMPDPQHFNKQFRAFYGCSPSARRRG